MTDSGRYQKTATELRKELFTIAKAATVFTKQLIRCRSCATLDSAIELKQKAYGFNAAMEYLSDSARAKLYVHLAASGFVWKDCIGITDKVYRLFLTAEIEPRAANRIALFYQDTLPVLEAISGLNVAISVPSSGRWRDPALANLIVAVEPVWRRVTNLTGARNSELESRFAAWLNSLLMLLGNGRAASLGMVLDVIRSKKSGTI